MCVVVRAVVRPGPKIRTWRTRICNESTRYGISFNRRLATFFRLNFLTGAELLLKTPFHFAGAVFDMVQRRSKPKFTGLAVLAALVVGFAARPVRCAELKQETVRAFEHYVSKSESRMETELQSGPFLHLEGLPAAQRSEALRRLRAGQILLWNENAKVGSPILSLIHI